MPQRQAWISEEWNGPWHLKNYPILSDHWANVIQEILWEEYFECMQVHPSYEVCPICKVQFMLRSETANL